MGGEASQTAIQAFTRQCPFPLLQLPKPLFTKSIQAAHRRSDYTLKAWCVLRTSILESTYTTAGRSPHQRLESTRHLHQRRPVVNIINQGFRWPKSRFLSCRNCPNQTTLGPRSRPPPKLQQQNPFLSLRIFLQLDLRRFTITSLESSPA